MYSIMHVISPLGVIGRKGVSLYCYLSASCGQGCGHCLSQVGTVKRWSLAEQ